MTAQRPRRGHRPLDARGVEELALRYVGRYATTRAKLLQYLRRKLRERGWKGTESPDPERIAARFVDLGYIDDRAFALSREATLRARGFGARRLQAALRSAGVGEDDGAAALALAASRAVEAAIRLAERRKLGPFAATAPASPRERDRALGTLLRGGHGFELARAIIDLAPGDEAGLADLRDRLTNHGG